MADLTPEQMNIKRAALNEYGVWNPPIRLAFGKNSVKDLIKEAYNDPREFVDILF